MAIKNTLIGAARNVKVWAGKNAPIILIGCGIAGFIATAVTTHRAAVKATKVIEEQELKTPKEKIKGTWKYYVTPTLLGVGSAAFIIAGTVQHQRRLAALAALCSASETALKEFKEGAHKMLGDSKSEKLQDAIAGDKIENNPPSDEIISKAMDNGKTLCYDMFLGRPFLSSIDDIKRAMNDLNSSIIHSEAVSLNEWYAELDSDLVSFGDNVGWDVDNLIDINFSSKLYKNTPIVAVSFKNNPKTLW